MLVWDFRGNTYKPWMTLDTVCSDTGHRAAAVLKADAVHVGHGLSAVGGRVNFLAVPSPPASHQGRRLCGLKRKFPQTRNTFLSTEKGLVKKKVRGCLLGGFVKPWTRGSPAMGLPRGQTLCGSVISVPSKVHLSGLSASWKPFPSVYHFLLILTSSGSVSQTGNWASQATRAGEKAPLWPEGRRGAGRFPKLIGPSEWSGAVMSSCTASDLLLQTHMHV